MGKVDLCCDWPGWCFPMATTKSAYTSMLPTKEVYAIWLVIYPKTLGPLVG